jgi:hypothetical protein
MVGPPSGELRCIPCNETSELVSVLESSRSLSLGLLSLRATLRDNRPLRRFDGSCKVPASGLFCTLKLHGPIPPRYEQENGKHSDGVRSGAGGPRLLPPADLSGCSQHHIYHRADRRRVVCTLGHRSPGGSQTPGVGCAHFDRRGFCGVEPDSTGLVGFLR